MTNILLREGSDKSLAKSLPSKVIFDSVEHINAKPSGETEGFSGNSDSGGSDMGFVNDPIISNAPNLHKQSGVFLSTEPFFKLIKCVHKMPAWIGAKLKYRAFFYELASRAVWKDEDFSWNGNIIRLKPGEWCSSTRRMAKEFSPEGLKGKASEDVFSKNDIEGAIHYFVKNGFLRQEIRQDVTVLSICHPVIYEENYKSNQTANQTIIRQKSDTNEERRERRDIKETIDRADAPVRSSLLNKNEKEEKNPSVFQPTTSRKPKTPLTEEKQKHFQLIWEYLFKNSMAENQTGLIPGVKEKDVLGWLAKYEGKEIFETIRLVQKADVSKSYPAYINGMLTKNVVKKEEASVTGKKFVEKFIKDNKLKYIEFRQDYFIDTRNGDQNNFSLPPHTLEELLKKSMERQNSYDSEEETDYENQNY